MDGRGCGALIHRLTSEVTDAGAAHVLVEHVVLGLPPAAANRITDGVRRLARGNRAADDEAGGKANAEADARARTATAGIGRVVEAIAPTAITAVTARAASLVLIDIGNSILLGLFVYRAPVGSACPFVGTRAKPVRGGAVGWVKGA